MKMTLHIDDALLERVMAGTGAKSKTMAVDLALREIDRRTELKRLMSEGLGLTSAELREAFDPASIPSDIVPATPPVSYGRKPRSRR